MRLLLKCHTAAAAAAAGKPGQADTRGQYCNGVQMPSGFLGRQQWSWRRRHRLHNRQKTLGNNNSGNANELKLND